MARLPGAAGGSATATLLLAGSVATLSAVSIFVGVIPMRPFDPWHLTPLQAQIVHASRLPRLASILMAGSGLSIAGLIMQQLSRNRFVSPTTAGTMDAARLGILVSVLFASSGSVLARIAVAFAFALAATLAFMGVLRRVRYRDAVFVPLVGLVFGNVINSVTTFIAYKYDLIQTLVVWLHGDFSMVLKGRYEILYLVVPLVAIAYGYANRFTIAGMGDDISTSLGLDYQKVVFLGLAVVACVSAVVVLTVGALPFLGLIVPNIVSLYRGDHMRKTLPDTALLGALLVLACDLIGRVILFPYEISVGLTMGILGSGAFLYLLWRSRHRAL